MERPKRNKSKDNPYELNIIENNQIIRFKDSNGIVQNVFVNNEIFNAFDSFELEDISQIHKYRSHIEYLDLTDEELYHRAVNKQETIEAIVDTNITNEKLKNAINELSDIQKRRIIKYFFDNKTLEEIAFEEGISAKNVWKSINIAIDKIKKNIKI